MTTKHRRTTARGKFATGRELASALGRSESRVARLRRGTGWPDDVPRNPPWSPAHVELLRTWLGARAGSGVLTESDLKGLGKRQREELRLIVERRLKLAVQRRMLERDLVDRREVERGRIERILETRKVLLGLPRELAGELIGRADRGEIEAVLTAGVERALAVFAGTDSPPATGRDAGHVDGA